MSTETVSVPVEDFIAAVRKRPCLWDPNHLASKNAMKRDLAYDGVALECGMASGFEAKCQWKKLRDSHREALRRRKKKVKNMLPWKYEEEMKFLVEHTEKSEERDRDNITFLEEDSLQEEDIEPTTFGGLHSSPSAIDQGMKKMNAEALEEKRQRYLQQEEMRNQSMELSQASDDALRTLFDSLCQKTRELPRYLQLRVQREVFESVLRAEEEALSLEPLASCYSPSSSTTMFNTTADSKSNIIPRSLQQSNPP